MAMEPRVQSLVDAMKAAFPPVDVRKTGTQVREELRSAAASVIERYSEPVQRVHDRELPGPHGPIPVRVYTPQTATGEPLPVVLFTHGGGWTLCDLDSHDGICRAVCNASGCVVVAVDYRLAPEHRFPIAAEDAYAAACWVAEHAAEVGGDGRMAVLGDSAGGNVAAVVALMARDRGTPDISGQVLVYPVIDHSDATPSHQEPPLGALTSGEAMYFWGQYLSTPEDGANPYASPIRAKDLSGLPRTLIVTAEHDPLRDEGEAYGQRLDEAGVPVTVHRYDGMFHSFFSFLEVLEEAKTLRDEVADELRALFELP